MQLVFALTQADAAHRPGIPLASKAVSMHKLIFFGLRLVPSILRFNGPGADPALHWTLNTSRR